MMTFILVLNIYKNSSSFKQSVFKHDCYVSGKIIMFLKAEAKYMLFRMLMEPLT